MRFLSFPRNGNHDTELNELTIVTKLHQTYERNSFRALLNFDLTIVNPNCREWNNGTKLTKNGLVENIFKIAWSPELSVVIRQCVAD